MAAALVIQYWKPDVEVGALIAGFWVLFTLLNYLPVGIYGELEMWLSSLKVITIAGFIIFGICIAAGAGQEGVLGFQYWRDPGPFNEYLVPGGAGQFVGFWAVLIQASVSYQGAERTSTRALYSPFQLPREPSGAPLLPNYSRHSPNRKLFTDIGG